MTNTQIIRKYNALLNRIDTMQIYDGRGTVDRYECQKCGWAIHTTYKDKGVTPFCMPCPRCGGMMQHTKTFDKSGVPASITVLNWYRPTLRQLRKLSEFQLQHVLNGGLILEK